MSRLLKEAWLLARYGIFYSAVSNAIFIFFLAVYLITVFPWSPGYLPLMAELCLGMEMVSIYMALFVCAGEVFARPSLNCIFQVQRSLAVIKIVAASIVSLLVWPMSHLVGQLFGWTDDPLGLQGVRLFWREWLILLLLANLYASRCVGKRDLLLAIWGVCIFISSYWRDPSLMFDLGLVLINGIIIVVDLQTGKGLSAQPLRTKIPIWHSVNAVVGSIWRRTYAPLMVVGKGPLVLLPAMLKFAPWYVMLLTGVPILVYSGNIFLPQYQGFWNIFSGYGFSLSLLTPITSHIYVQALRRTRFAMLFAFFENRQNLLAALERHIFVQIVLANFSLVFALSLIPIISGSHNSLLAPALLLVPLVQLLFFYNLLEVARIDLALWQTVIALMLGCAGFGALLMLNALSDWPWYFAALSVPLLWWTRKKCYARWQTCNLAFACRLPVDDPRSIGGRYAASV